MYFLDDLLSHRLSTDFYQQPTLKVCEELLGKKLVVTKNGTLQVANITEVEAYLGVDDLACHASKGRTPRTQIMFGPPGRLYIYLIYGVYYLMNIVSEPKNSPGGILIRALQPLQNIVKPIDGPGKLTKVLNITNDQLGLDLSSSPDIFISSFDSPQKHFVAKPRVGINYAGEPWVSVPWRYIAI